MATALQSTRLERGARTGWLYNYHPTTERSSNDDDDLAAAPDGGDDVIDGGGDGYKRRRRHGNASAAAAGDGTAAAATSSSASGGGGRAALVLLFQDHAGERFHVHVRYSPYFYVLAVDGHEREVELGLLSTFGPQLIEHVTMVEKEDLDLVNHLSGRKRLYLKLSFSSVRDLMHVRGRLARIVKRNAATLHTDDAHVWRGFATRDEGDGGSSDVCDVAAGLGGGGGVDDGYGDAAMPRSGRWSDWVQDMREYDVKYHTRVAIDLRIFCGCWYDVRVVDGDAAVTRCDDSAYAPAMPRVVAFDIETTKAPLRFPHPEVDQVYMISYMLDGRGYLIVNREIVTADIDAFEYTPRPEYEGVFSTYNEPDEAATLRRFFDEMRRYEPNVYVTYNGDYFDFPFLHARALVRGMQLRDEIGFAQGADGAFVNPRAPHLDCFYWVKRDSYLPQGSQGLKAVTRHKLGYEPIEVSAEDMLPLAQSQPQRMASYSVSDAVSTWYLYLKYVHPFIYSLATIIPMPPDDVLRKGSGGLCEALLMVQAEANHVIFPNKKEQDRERFHDGHLIDTETYIGGRVEALRSGVYRCDLPMQFVTSSEAYQRLMDELDDTLRFAIETENGLRVADVVNYAAVRAEVHDKLAYLRDHSRQQARPIIYHLDVGAMYPNIILTNRLQPYAIARPEVCAGCCFNTPDNAHQCKRAMAWQWRGELFTASRYEFERVKAQLEHESFAATAIAQANLAAVQKKAYGTRKGNVLEGTVYEQRDGNNNNSNNGGYRRHGEALRLAGRAQQQQQPSSLSSRGVGVLRHGRDGDKRDSDSDGGQSDGDSDSDGDGPRAYHKLNESTQFNMLKRRLAEYSRRAYGKVHESRELLRTNVVCQRENAFYVDTVRLFRDRRYEYKAALKMWKGRLSAATTPEEVKLCESRCVQMESLQLAHKCILNSFYGYVMRKGSRWSSMEMAGIVTYLGASLIQMARALVQQIGVTLELDTDGIWCCLPCTFPENVTLQLAPPPTSPSSDSSSATTTAKAKTLTISYPCVVLNKMVHDRYSNPQYQTLVRPGVYTTHRECSIYFEVDGPYRAMLLPASLEEGKGIKKRYAVFHLDGRLAELKGFELKRRGELALIKDFQSHVFARFLDGDTLVEAYASAAHVANAALDLLASRGADCDADEVLEKLSESSNMTRRLSEYPATQKSLAITTARRIAEFLGPQMVKDKGLACHFVVARQPVGRPVTERAIPVTIFRAEAAVRTHFLRKWTGDAALPSSASHVDLRALLDWDYYTARFAACVQKILTIPAALQSVPNPVPRVAYPEWLQGKLQQRDSRYRQCSLVSLFHARRTDAAAHAQGLDKDKENDTRDVDSDKTSSGHKDDADGQRTVCDVEDMALPLRPPSQQQQQQQGQPSSPSLSRTRATHHHDDESSTSSDDSEVADGEGSAAAAAASEARARAREAAVQTLRARYFAAKSTTPLDEAFFAHKGLRTWLRQQRQSWLHRAQLRRELVSTGCYNGVDDVGDEDSAGDNKGDGATRAMQQQQRQQQHSSSSGGHGAAAVRPPRLLDAHATALTTTWQILEVRESSSTSSSNSSTSSSSNNSNNTGNDTVTVVALLAQSLCTLRVRVPRRIYVDVDVDEAVGRGGGVKATTAVQRMLLPLLGEATAATLTPVQRVLPRHVTPGHLLACELAAGARGDAQLAALRTCEGVREVYEAHLTHADAFVAAVGCCAAVRVARHVQHARERRAALRDVFDLDDLEAVGGGSYLALRNESSVSVPVWLSRMAFVYHAMSSDTRGVLAAVHAGTGHGVVVFVQPAAAERPALPWRTLCDEEAARAASSYRNGGSSSNDDDGSDGDGGNAAAALMPRTPQLTTHVAHDMASAWRVIYRALSSSSSSDTVAAAASSSSSSPVLCVLQSMTSTVELLRSGALPAHLPYLRVLGVADDERLFADPFRWQRLLARRLLQRFFAAALWVDERLAVSRLAGVPLCNLAQDSWVHALDTLYTRALRRHGHVLWCSADPATAHDTLEERPRQVAMPGGYVATWCVELSLARIAVVAVLFAQTLQEADDPAGQALCDRGVTTHFNLLRDVVAELLGQAVHHGTADALLAHVARWLRDPAAACYEPRLAELLASLTHRVLTAVLVRLAKLGGRAVRVDETSVVVLTSKSELREAMHFVRYVTSAMQDEPMLQLLALQPTRFWCPLLVLDRRGYMGLYVDAATAMAACDTVVDNSHTRGGNDDDNNDDGGSYSNNRSEDGDVDETVSRNFGVVYVPPPQLPARAVQLLLTRVHTCLRQLLRVTSRVRAAVLHDRAVTLATRSEHLARGVLQQTQRLVEGDVQTAVMEEVQRLLDGRDATGKDDGGGSSSSSQATTPPQPRGGSAAVALLYAKVLCAVLQHVPCNEAVGKMRNNCMRLCGVSPFSVLAELDSSGSGAAVASSRLLRMACPCCNALVDLDLAAGGSTSSTSSTSSNSNAAAGKASADAAACFVCPACQSPLAAAAVEARLVRRVQQLVLRYTQMDFVCSRCREMAATYLCESCCGPLVGKAASLRPELEVLQGVASLHGFAWLHEYDCRGYMLRSTSWLLALRPRHIMYTPPPLARRTGSFRCKVCKHEWHSDYVWVTRTTQRVYQGESCTSCGTTNKPYYVGRPQETIFNRVRTPHPVKPGASTSRHGRKLKHLRYDPRVRRYGR